MDVSVDLETGTARSLIVST